MFYDSNEFIKGKITKFLAKTAGTPVSEVDYCLTYKILYLLSVFYEIKSIRITTKKLKVINNMQMAPWRHGYIVQNSQRKWNNL